MSLRLVRLPSGAWALLAIADAQHLEMARCRGSAAPGGPVREDLAASGRVPFLALLSAVGGRS